MMKERYVWYKSFTFCMLLMCFVTLIVCVELGATRIWYLSWLITNPIAFIIIEWKELSEGGEK